MSIYRSHNCGQLSKTEVGSKVKLSGWIFRMRDHGGVLFVDLRDHFGLTQVVFHPKSGLIEGVSKLGLESVIMVEGEVLARSASTVNPKMATGEIEVNATKFEVLGAAEPLPWALAADDTPEELRLKYRPLDLRRDRMHNNVVLHNNVVASLRKRMWAEGFQEFQTPILTASSPEGARDFLVPARQHPGKFYALPQAPQQFKQLLMMSGFDRYFQIAPCFRDEDARADRSAGEFYQLDMEMSFVQQEDVWALKERVIQGVFEEFANGKAVDKAPFVRIPYDESMLKYGIDKPDLRNPIVIHNVAQTFAESEFQAFKDIVAKGGIVRAMAAPKAAEKPRSWFDNLGDWSIKELGMKFAPGYISKTTEGYKGPIAKFLQPAQIDSLFTQCGAGEGDVVFFIAGTEKDKTVKQGGLLRIKLGQELNLIDKNCFKLCWIVDFPFYELSDEGKVDFCHNPFSMPNGGMEALNTQDPLDIKASQYDLVCNGYELTSGAIRNHRPDVMVRAFEIAGYTAKDVEDKFGGMLKAFKLGAPPHGGCASGIARIVMLLADEPNIREIIAFPLNQRAEDLLMGAPNTASERQLKELHIKHVSLPGEKSAEKKPVAVNG